MIDTKHLFRDLVRIEVARQFPRQGRGRPRLLSFDEAYDGILRVMRTGMQWRQLRSQSVSHITVFKTMHRWIDASIFRTAYRRLLILYHRTRRPKYYCIDSSFVKNVFGVDCTGRNPTDRGRRATKLSVLVDDLGIPVSFLTSPGNTSDMRLFNPVFDAAVSPLERDIEVFADKGYDSRANREDNLVVKYILALNKYTSSPGPPFFYNTIHPYSFSIDGVTVEIPHHDRRKGLSPGFIHSTPFIEQYLVQDHVIKHLTQR